MSPSSPAGSSSSLPSSNALLALPDGPIPAGHPDTTSHVVSLIGGYPTFPSLPSSSKPPEMIRCGVCHEPIPLLAQVYCPPEGGENDRTVYVWACPRPSCQRRDGSVRAFRASVRNEDYVKDVAEKRAAAEKQAAEERERGRKNPFCMPDATLNGSLFGSSQPLFGVSSSKASSDESDLIPPNLSTLSIISPSPSNPSSSGITWKPPLSAYHPCQYLSTVDEYLPDPEDEDMDKYDDEDETSEQKAEFRDARFEQLLPQHMDEVFERFVRRLQNADGASSQVLRYDLGGVPLPYSSASPLYRRLFPGAPTTRTPDEEEEPDFAEFYDMSTIPPCPQCGGKRVFELQLVPSLISILQPDTLTTTGQLSNGIRKGKQSAQSEEERKMELARLASGAKDKEQGVGEMEWGNVLVFGCKNDCVGFGEEWVGAEWEANLSQD